MMRRTAGFHDHGCRRLTCKEDGQLISRQPMVLVDVTRTMRDSNFKNGLCDIDGDGRMLHGTPPDVWFLRTDRDDFDTSMPFKSPGGVHFISCAAGQRQSVRTFATFVEFASFFASRHNAAQGRFGSQRYSNVVRCRYTTWLARNHCPSR